jgi:uncharacterized protein
MGIETNKAIVQELLSNLGTDDLEGIAKLLDDGLVWWSAGGEYFPLSGERTKNEVMEIFGQFSENFPGGLQLKPVVMVAEGDRVTAEVVGYGVALNGRTYENYYHFSFRLQGGKVVEAKEYLDTLYAKVVLLDS